MGFFWKAAMFWLGECTLSARTPSMMGFNLSLKQEHHELLVFSFSLRMEKKKPVEIYSLKAFRGRKVEVSAVQDVIISI